MKKSHFQQSGKFWDFWENGVTQSMLNTWIFNKHICKLQYVDGWTVPGENDSIIFGNMAHYVLERAYTGNEIPSPTLIESFVDDYCHKICNWDKFTDEHKNNYSVISAKVTATMQCYFGYYHDDFKRQWSVSEHVFKVPYVYPDGKATWITGMIDQGFNSHESIVDHKCKGQVNDETNQLLMEVDLQSWIYSWAIKQVRKERGDKIVYPKSFVRNVIRISGIRQDSRKKESRKDFMDRLLQKILKDGFDYYFRRYELEITPEALDAWETNVLDPLMLDFRQWVESGYKAFSYLTEANLETRWGSAHPMARAIVEGNFSGLYQRKKVFQELV